jgi:glyoxylase I family protein
MNLRHVGITVKNLEQSIFFYRDLLGFEIKKQMKEQGTFIDKISGLSNVVVTTTKMKHPDASDGGMIELLKYHSHDTVVQNMQINHGGITHFALTVKNINKIHEKLLKNKIHFNCKPLLSDDGGATVTFCRDYENNLIEMVEMTR